MIQKYVVVSGAALSNNGSATNAVIAAQTAKTIRVTAVVLAVTTAATGGGGIVSLKDGGTEIIRFDANSVMASQFNLGDQLGYPLTSGNALNLVVSGAGGNQATVYASAVGYLAG